MNYFVLLIGLGLAALWIISLAIHAAATWFTWLVFIAAVGLLVAAFAGVASSRRAHRTI